MRRTNLRGHALRSEGKAYKRTGDGDWDRVSFGPYPGSHIGVALCECGETSAELTSDSKRKAWHAGHKAAYRGTGQ